MTERHKISINSFEIMCFELGIDKEIHIQNLKNELLRSFENQIPDVIIENIKSINSVAKYVKLVYDIYDQILANSLRLILCHFDFWEEQLDFDTIFENNISTDKKEALQNYLLNIELVVKFDREFNISAFRNNLLEKKPTIVIDDNILLVYKYFNIFIADGLYNYETEILIKHKTEDEVIAYSENVLNFDYAFNLLKLITNSNDFIKNFKLNKPCLNIFKEIVDELTDLTQKFTFLHEIAHLISKEEHQCVSNYEKELMADHFALCGLILNSSEYKTVKCRTIIGIVTSLFIIGFKNAISETNNQDYPSPNERLKYALFVMGEDDDYSENLMREISRKINILFNLPIQKLKNQYEYKN